MTEALLREGDTVTVKATVRFDEERSDDGSIHVRVGHRDCVVDRGDVTLVRRVFHLGEPVAIIGSTNILGHVRALCDNAVWVRMPDGCMGTFFSEGLQVFAEPAPKADTAPESAAPLPEVPSNGAEEDQGEVQF